MLACGFLLNIIWIVVDPLVVVPSLGATQLQYFSSCASSSGSTAALIVFLVLQLVLFLLPILYGILIAQRLSSLGMPKKKRKTRQDKRRTE